MTTNNAPVALQAASQVARVPQAGSPPAQPKPSSVQKLPRVGFWTMARLAVFAIVAVWTLINLAWLWSAGIDPKGVIWALWWPAIFVLQFSILATPWRAVTLKEIGRMFLIGLSITFFAVYITENLLVGVLTAFPDYNPVYQFLRLDFVLGGFNMMADVVSPIVEEIFKILPVVIFLLIAGRGYWRRALGPLDVALLGGASGAGFLFMENIARITAGYWEKLGPNRSVWEASFGIDPFFIFPDMYHGSVSVWPGHPETAMFIGLCLGFGLLLRRKLPVIWAAIPVLGTLWMIWLHFMINYLDPGNQQLWAQIVMILNLNGGLFQYVLILGLLLAIGVSTITKYLYLANDKKATLAVVGKQTLEYVRANRQEPLKIAKKLWSLRHFWSFRHAVAYGVLYTKQQKPEEREKWIPWLRNLRRIAIGKGYK